MTAIGRHNRRGSPDFFENLKSKTLELADRTTIGAFRCRSSPCEYNNEFKIGVGVPCWRYEGGCDE